MQPPKTQSGEEEGMQIEGTPLGPPSTAGEIPYGTPGEDSAVSFEDSHVIESGESLNPRGEGIRDNRAPIRLPSTPTNVPAPRTPGLDERKPVTPGGPSPQWKGNMKFEPVELDDPLRLQSKGPSNAMDKLSLECQKEKENAKI